MVDGPELVLLHGDVEEEVVEAEDALDQGGVVEVAGPEEDAALVLYELMRMGDCRYLSVSFSLCCIWSS